MNALFVQIAKMDMRQRIVAALAVLAMGLAVAFLYRVANSPSLVLLYSGLDTQAASDVVGALEQQAVPFELRGNAIYVEQDQRDALRLDLAGQGLPAQGLEGYEILDTLSDFGTTTQMFDAAYWRAKEGELARTILSSTRARSARVHIASDRSRPFAANPGPTASVTVALSGGRVSAEQAQAIRHLVASAVTGLLPEKVAVIDGGSGLLVAGDSDGAAGLAGGAPGELSQRLKAGVENLIAARVGADRVIVEVSVETETASETLLEHSFDPETRVVISSETTETTDQQTGTSPANVTIASNLPDGETGGGGQSSTNSDNTSERLNYEVSESTRETRQPAGRVKRISTAVLVDGITSADADGNPVWSPRPPEEIAILTDLVKSAVGYDESRGDVVTLTSLEFPAPPQEGTVVQSSWLGLFAVNVMRLIQLAVLGLVALVLGLFVVRPILTRTLDAPQIALPPPEPVAGAASGQGQLADHSASNTGPPDPVRLLREVVAARTAESAVVLRNWIESDPDMKEPT